MYTFDVDWSPSINLGHNKFHEGDQQKVQERADRKISRNRMREDEEFEAQLLLLSHLPVWHWRVYTKG